MYSQTGQVLWKNKTYSFKKYVFYAHCVKGIVLSSGNFAVRKTKTCALMEQMLSRMQSEGTHKINKYVMSQEGVDKSEQEK